MALPFRYVKVLIGTTPRTVKVDHDALVPINTLKLAHQHVNAKVKIHRNNGESYTLGSLPEQLYGSSYRFARHIVRDPFDLRRTAYAQSKQRLKRMKLA